MTSLSSRTPDVTLSSMTSRNLVRTYHGAMVEYKNCALTHTVRYELSNLIRLS
jgi:hypothetical protein